MTGEEDMAKHAGNPAQEFYPGSIQQTDPANQVAREAAYPIDTSQERAEQDAALYFPEETS